MKLLNLDELVSPVKTVTYKGVSYDVEELGVGAFLQVYKESQALRTKEDVAENISATLRNIKHVIPTMPDDVLNGMKLDQLFTLTSFVNGTLDELKQVGDEVVQQQAQAEGEQSGN